MLRKPGRTATREACDDVFVAHDASFRRVTGERPALVRVVDTDAHEGPVYAPDEDALYFTSVPRPGSAHGPDVAIKRVALDGDRFPVEPERVGTLRSRANAANGMTISGDLVVCEQGSHTQRAQISRVDRVTGSAATVVDAWRAVPLNSPNDVIVRADGTVWFTDPSYGYLQGFRPHPSAGDYVYRHDPANGATDVVDDSFDKPNGIAFSPDEQTLYVTDSGANQERDSYYVDRPHHIVAFDVVGDRHLRNRRLLAVTTPGFPDGLKCDEEGRVYASCAGGVQVLSPDGDLLGEIVLPGAVNFTFGGADGNVLFITTDDAIWAAVLGARGFRGGAERSGASARSAPTPR